MKTNISGAWNQTTMKSNVSEVLKKKKKKNLLWRESFFLSYKSKIMSLLRILAKKKTSSTLNSSTQQTTSANSTPNLEPPSLFPTQEESGNYSFTCYLLGTFFSQCSTPSPCQCRSHGKKLTCCMQWISSIFRCKLYDNEITASKHCLYASLIFEDWESSAMKLLMHLYVRNWNNNVAPIRLTMIKIASWLEKTQVFMALLQRPENGKKLTQTWMRVQFVDLESVTRLKSKMHIAKRNLPRKSL